MRKFHRGLFYYQENYKLPLTKTSLNYVNISTSLSETSTTTTMAMVIYAIERVATFIIRKQRVTANTLAKASKGIWVARKNE